ncbi:hypothetical protein [Actinopolyspora mortivallis]|uniref:hypothetical protein n=1 Tax=Actinopolyspora mortivallis TaxID=33906 RepID=UPI000363E949|nr:hypothetical protein [Actinopolyspora mortivallis]
MTIERGSRFDVESDQVFPQGALMQGEIFSDMEFVSNGDATRGKKANQRKDERTGLLRWKVLVSDPSAEKECDASVTVVALSEVQPVPPESVQVVPGLSVRPVEFTDMTVEPRVMGDKFKYLGYTVRAKGIATPGQAAIPQPQRPASAVKSTADKSDEKPTA